MRDNKSLPVRTLPISQGPVTVMEVVMTVVFILSLLVVVAVIIKSLLMAVYRNPGGDGNNYLVLGVPTITTPTTLTTPTPQPSKGDEPCCLPYKFQAVITPLAKFDAAQKKIMRVYRDWESRLQAMEQTSFDDKKGIVLAAHSKSIYDYKHNKAYQIQPDRRKCVSWEINSGMLEPCMPENAQYLGSSYIGYHEVNREFKSFYFRRTDKNRNMEMTIAVTRDRCVPIMEHIKGKIGDANADNLVFFSNVTDLQDETVFNVPDYCFNQPD